MKTKNTCYKAIISFTLFLLLIAGKTLDAQQIQDSQYGFSIYIPADWSKSSRMDGSDKVYDFYSANQNVAVQLRVFKANPKVTVGLLAKTYEQNMLPKGTKKQSLENYTSQNGISGKKGIYSFEYNRNPVDMLVFYAVQKGTGYVLAAMVPSGITGSEKEAVELKQVTLSFRISGISPRQPGSSAKTGGGGIGGSVKSYGTGTSAPGPGIADVAGKYRLVSRTDGNNSLNYWYLTLYQDGTFADRHQIKGNPPYTTGEEGTWEIKGNKVTLYNKYHPAVYTVYSFDNDRLVRTTRTCVFTFEK